MSQAFSTVYETPERRVCMEMQLVLQAVGLNVRVFPSEQHWQLMVAEHDVDIAIAELTAYQKEKHEARNAVSSLQIERNDVGRQLTGGAILFAMAIVACTWMGWAEPTGAAITDLGHVDAGLVHDGQWWRTFTALTLHADWPHLLSNLVFGALFFTLAGRWFGGGIAALLTLFGGATGNLLNAYLHDASHASLGASTAVFSALGIAVAIALRVSLQAKQGTTIETMKRWSPLIAGGLLLAMTGTGGESTDVGAHVAGFATGAIIGWASSYLPQSFLAKKPIQRAAMAVTLSTIVATWVIALNFGG